MVFGEDWVGVFDFVHVWESWCMIEESWLLVVLNVVVYLDGGAAPVLPCVEAIVLMMLVSWVLAVFVRHGRERAWALAL